MIENSQLLFRPWTSENGTSDSVTEFIKNNTLNLKDQDIDWSKNCDTKLTKLLPKVELNQRLNEIFCNYLPQSSSNLEKNVNYYDQTSNRLIEKTCTSDIKSNILNNCKTNLYSNFDFNSSILIPTCTSPIKSLPNSSLPNSSLPNSSLPNSSIYNLPSKTITPSLNSNSTNCNLNSLNSNSISCPPNKCTENKNLLSKIVSTNNSSELCLSNETRLINSRIAALSAVSQILPLTYANNLHPPNLQPPLSTLANNVLNSTLECDLIKNQVLSSELAHSSLHLQSNQPNSINYLPQSLPNAQNLANCLPPTYPTILSNPQVHCSTIALSNEANNWNELFSNIETSNLNLFNVPSNSNLTNLPKNAIDSITNNQLLTNLNFTESANLSATNLDQTQMSLASFQPVKKIRPKKFLCEFCKVSFSNNGQLKGHIRIHTGERPFICDTMNCGKSFTRNEELTRHKKIHTGLKPFSCEMCGKKFGRKDHLKKHIRTHQRAAHQQQFSFPLMSALGQYWYFKI